MLSKSSFCEALRLIKEQDEINHKVSDALSLVGDGFYIFGANNKHFDALMMVLKEAMNDKYDNIEWWLYEAAPDYEISYPATGKLFCLKEPEALYDYIVNECQD